MSYRDVLRIFKLERELTDDETALLNALRETTEADRIATVEAFGGTMGKASSKSAKVKTATTRKYERCDVCNLTRRAVEHRDTDANGYHEFQSSKPKSARASSIAEKVAKVNAGNGTPTTKPLLCDYSIDGKVCKGTVNDAIHDEGMGYAAYHPFQSGVPSAGSSSSTGESGVSSEVETASV